MVQPTPLYHVNGGKHLSDETDGVQCAQCSAWLGQVRAVASTPSGTKFFCKMEPGDKAEDSCYLQWKMRRH